MLDPAPRERGILMRGELVVESLTDRKTQTRRPNKFREFQPSATRGYDWTFRNRRGLWCDVSHARLLELCPYGVRGDRLYVREAWRAIERESDSVDGVLFRADGAFRRIENTREGADRWVEAYDNGRHGERWRPGIHMPRWASRLLLEIVDVRVERVQSISEEDAKAEGVKIPDAATSWQSTVDVYGMTPYRAAFAAKWAEIHDRGPFAWGENPFVWCISFRRVV